MENGFLFTPEREKLVNKLSEKKLALLEEAKKIILSNVIDIRTPLLFADEMYQNKNEGRGTNK